MRSEDQQKRLSNELGSGARGRSERRVLEFRSHCPTLQSTFGTEENKRTMLAFRLRRFKHRPILKTAKGHAEGDLAW